MEQILDRSLRIWYQLVPSLQLGPHTVFIHSPRAIYTFQMKLNQWRHQTIRLQCLQSECEVIMACVDEQGTATELLTAIEEIDMAFFSNINYPLLFINWQLRLWCYFCEAPVMLMLLFL